MPKLRAISYYLAIGFAINIAITWIGSQCAPLGVVEATDRVYTCLDIRGVSTEGTAKSFADLQSPPDGMSEDELIWAREVERLAISSGNAFHIAPGVQRISLNASEMIFFSTMISHRDTSYKAHDVRSDINGDFRFRTRYEVGFPFRSLAAEWIRRSTTWKGDLRAELPLEWLPGRSLTLFTYNGHPAPHRDTRPLPFLPMWPGLIANTAIYALIPAMIPLLLHWWRVRRKLCGHCGYARAGLATSAACPECGTVPGSSRKQDPSASAPASIR
jgi:hypothetical protein